MVQLEGWRSQRRLRSIVEDCNNAETVLQIHCKLLADQSAPELSLMVYAYFGGRVGGNFFLMT